VNAPLGGVAERLIAPVLKTGRPKGLVSSNLTPSAILLRVNAVRRIWQGPLREAGCPPIVGYGPAISFFRCRLRIADWPKKKMRHQNGAKNSENCREHNVRKIVRVDVHARETDQDGDGQTSKASSTVREK
jgi:hypothetical protein